MTRIELFTLLSIMSLILFACNPVTVTLPAATAPLTAVPEATPTSLVAATQGLALFPLSEHGQYFTGKRLFTLYDASRDNRKVEISVWYPAIRPEGNTGNMWVNAVPKPADKPYPVILMSARSGGQFAQHLTSYGFIVVGILSQFPAEHWGQWLIDYPLDFVFVLNQLASNPPEELAGLMDTNHAGAMGYSFDGYNSLALSGARIDPEFYHAQCSQAALMDPMPAAWWIDYICNLDGGWDAFISNAGRSITTSRDGLWQPITDERIRAVMPMAPEGAWLFGERGLAAVDRPTLIIAATNDQLNYYDLEASTIFQHLGTPDCKMISFINKDHYMIGNDIQIAWMSHFATAFFGYYLQGNQDDLYYFSKDFIALNPDLAWGVYARK